MEDKERGVDAGMGGERKEREEGGRRRRGGRDTEAVALIS